MIEMVVFDMAGTTINEDNVVYKTVQKAINEAGYDVSLEQVLALGAGKEKRKAIEDIIAHYFTEVEAEVIESIFKSFKSQLETAYQALNVSAIEGTEDVFDFLHGKGIKVVLNTGYDRKTASSLLNKLNWVEGKEFDLLVTADDVKNGRPNPDMIHLAMETFGIKNAENVVKIGDSAIDIEEGKAANCGITIGVLSGAQNHDQLKVANPDYIADSLLILKEIIK